MGLVIGGHLCEMEMFVYSFFLERKNKTYLMCVKKLKGLVLALNA